MRAFRRDAPKLENETACRFLQIWSNIFLRFLGEDESMQNILRLLSPAFFLLVVDAWAAGGHIPSGDEAAYVAEIASTRDQQIRLADQTINLAVSRVCQTNGVTGFFTAPQAARVLRRT